MLAIDVVSAPGNFASRGRVNETRRPRLTELIVPHIDPWSFQNRAAPTSLLTTASTVRNVATSMNVGTLFSKVAEFETGNHFELEEMMAWGGPPADD